MHIVKPTTLQHWEKRGKPKVLAEARQTSMYLQNYVDPRDGSIHEFVQFSSVDWCNICAITPEGNLVMVREFKQGADDIVTEFPAGHNEPGEDVTAAARRELLEETGCRPEQMIKLGTSLIMPRRSKTTFTAFLEPISKSRQDKSARTPA